MLISITSFADSFNLEPGSKLITSVDWKRIERGLTTGDFSCRGTCLEISIDWKEIWRTISGKKYRDQKKRDIVSCISGYQQVKNLFDFIRKMEEEGRISNVEVLSLIESYQCSIESIDSVCEDMLGKNKANNLKASILGREHQ